MSTHAADEIFSILIEKITTYKSVRDSIEIARKITTTPAIRDRFIAVQVARLNNIVLACDQLDKENGIHRIEYDTEPG